MNKPIGNNNFTPVNNTKHGRALIARRDLWPGQVIATLTDAMPVDEMDIYSVQIGRNRHIRHWIVDHLNHSCESNVRLDTANRAIIATRHIIRGEELTFFYPSTEWEMLRPFPCDCGSSRCIGRIAGAKFLSPDVLQHYELTDHVIELLDEVLAHG